MPTMTRDTVEEYWDTETLLRCYKNASKVDAKDFLDRLKSFLGASGKMWATHSARFALQQFLSDAVSHEKRFVLVCSFNCRVVADAVTKAGFEVETFDLADVTGRIDWPLLAEQLKQHHGALVIPHLFGVPNDFRPVQEVAEELGVWIIEDCAPTLGGRIGDCMAGTLGDAAIFSFNYDKPISLGGGGALLVNNPDLWSKIRLPQKANGLDSEAQELKLFTAYLRRRRKRINRPWLSLSDRIFGYIKRRIWSPQVKEPFPVSGIGPLRAALGIWQLDRHREVIIQRNNNASFFAHEECRSWFVGPTVTPAWLKQKVFPDKATDIGRISQRLQSQGLRVGLFNWPITIDGYLGRTEKPNAHYTARHCLDIPIHQNMMPNELEVIRNAVCSEHINELR